MANNPEESSEEYQFNGDQESYDDAYPTKHRPVLGNIVESIRAKRKFLGPIIFVTLLILGFRWYNASINRHQSAKASVRKQKKPAQHVTKAAVIKKTTTQKKMAEIPPQPQPVQHTKHTQQHQVSQQQLTGLQSEVYNVRSQLTNLRQGLNALSHIVREQVTQNKAAKVQAGKKLMKALPYQVTGVIPERAWLLSPKGQTITVRPGTVIPQLGVVTNIDAVNGIVTTDKGLTIQFAGSDR